MAANRNLHQAKKNKKDEFYTQLADVERELHHYRHHFAGRTVFCNCDDPTESAFWEYFHLNFAELGLKKLISTHYSATERTYKLEYSGGNDNDIEVGVRTDLLQNGDFRSDECIELLKEADIVVTNPPFSLFREYVAQLIEYNKKFIIIGHQNAITYKEFFPLIKDNKVWLGYGFKGGAAHFINKEYEDYATAGDHRPGMIRVSGVVWYTNLDIKKRHEDLILWKPYSPEEYPKYDNYDAINVDKTSDIPVDYFEAIGVPITFLDKYNPDQFEILGLDRYIKGNKTPNRRFILVERERERAASPRGVCAHRNQEEVLIPVHGDREVVERILIQEYGYSPEDLSYRSGIIGVPITFLNKYNPEQFEILGHEHDLNGNGGPGITHGQFEVNGKGVYKRILIRKKT